MYNKHTTMLHSYDEVFDLRSLRQEVGVRGDPLWVGIV
jgi:hypothetical protein